MTMTRKHEKNTKKHFKEYTENEKQDKEKKYEPYLPRSDSIPFVCSDQFYSNVMSTK